MDYQIFVLTHGNDLDGLGSAALIMRKYYVPLKNIFFLDYGEKKLNYAIENIVRMSGRKSIVFIADTGMNDRQVSPFKRLVLHIRKRGGRVFWFDHHHWKKNQIRDIARICDLAIVGENEYACAAEITLMELGLKDKFSVMLAKMAHETDFAPILHPYIRDAKNPIEVYGLVFSYYNTIDDIEKQTASLRRVVGMLSSGKFLNTDIVNRAGKFESKTKLELSRIERQIYSVNKDFSIGFAQSINSNIACDQIRKLTNSDVVLYIDTTHNKGHFRSTNTNIIELAASFGGGGHTHSAGFDIDKRKFADFRTKRQRQKFVDMISKSVERSKLY